MIRESAELRKKRGEKKNVLKFSAKGLVLVLAGEKRSRSTVHCVDKIDRTSV